MQKILISKEQLHDLVMNNRYKVEQKTQYISRCIDGRYQNKEDLPPLAIPGADAGELALILATGNIYGFEVDKEKALNVLTNILGGVKQFNFHSDHHGNPNIPTSGCGHMKMLTLNPKSYHLEKDQIDFINRTLTNIKKQGAKETILEGDHQEGAALTIKGQYGIFPRFTLETEGDDIETQAFVFHSTLVNERHRLVAKKLIE
ncbi:hypothetical protein HYW87_02615, partial [Candidatus Roizmanbacteria bacterium]|nr:hypothetical protein [Candidatus Roizmanbacteria bacterium]